MSTEFPVIDGYEILDVLGSGAMGTVYRARYQRTGEEVALKVTLHPRNHRRHFREAMVLAELQHENVVGYVAHGPTHLAMTLLKGESLADYFERGETLTHKEAFAIMSQICAGLAAAHALDAIHRDVKPENIFLSRDDDGSWHAILIDFGIVWIPDGEEVTNPHLDLSKPLDDQRRSVMGTMTYMSPEQALGDPLTPESDVYTVGLVLVEMLITGRTHVPEATLMHELRMKGPFPVEIAELLNNDEAKALRHLLAYDAHERLSAKDASEALKHISKGEDPFPAHQAVVVVEAVSPQSDPIPVEPATAPQGSSQLPLLLFGILLGALVAAVAIRVVTRESAPIQIVARRPQTIILPRSKPPVALPVVDVSPVVPPSPPAPELRCNASRGLSYDEQLRVGRERLPDRDCWSRLPATRRERICARLERHGHGHDALTIALCTSLP